ncbi:MAG: carbohydrate ABC transporter permease [Sphaerochaetaceae bacterium]|nr:carbohydrate ABC transporter permease [Spirochaetales bacterium]MDY5500476.1 carbohydrate ABC transporter permease [Sphaerochaetaceae bacterium]
MRTNHILGESVRLLVLGAIAIIFIYPFWWMVVNSLNSAAEIFGKPRLLPVSWRWTNYLEIFQVQPFARHYLNTLYVAILGTAGNIIVASLSGYAFARLRFPGRNGLFLLLLTGMMMPIEVEIIPLYFEMQKFHALDTLTPLVLIPMFCSQGAFSAFMFRQFFVTMPDELEEAARLDGLHPIGIYTRIMFPLSQPIVASAAILTFLSIWNSYLEPLVFLSDIQKFTLPLSLANFNDSYGLPQWHLQLAATTLSVIPIMAVYSFFQEKICDAMVNTGMK